MSSLAPSRNDFLSDRESGKRPRDRSPETLRRHLGFSVWTTKAGALAAASRYPQLRKRFPFVAEMELPDDARVEPFTEMLDHLTAFGDPDAFVTAVIATAPVDLDE